MPCRLRHNGKKKKPARDKPAVPGHRHHWMVSNVGPSQKGMKQDYLDGPSQVSLMDRSWLIYDGGGMELLSRSLTVFKLLAPEAAGWLEWGPAAWTI